MKIIFDSNRRNGSVMVTTLVIAMLVGIVVAALLFVAQEQSRLTARARVWASEIPMAEAGIEEALAHLNTHPASWAMNGWTLSGTNFVKRRDFTNSYFYTTIIPTSAKRFTVVSVGYARVPLNTNYTQRTVMASVRATTTGWGFVGIKSVSMNGSPYIDSYNSSDPLYSTNGFYAFSKRRDSAGVGSLSSDVNAINTGSAQIYGTAATGPDGTVAGNVGDGIWLATYGGLQPGSVTDDFNMAVPDVKLTNFIPLQTYPLAAKIPSFGSDGLKYPYTLATGDWQFNGNTSLSGNGMRIVGKVRIFFNGDFSMSGSTAIRIEPGSSVQIYLGGSMDITGQGVANVTGIPGDCAIYGLPTCTSIKYKGTSAAYATIYAPQAAVEIGGTADFSGTAVGNTLQFSGTGNIHYDEALNKNTVPDYRVFAWEEL